LLSDPRIDWLIVWYILVL